jgi:hypothetical protein
VSFASGTGMEEGLAMADRHAASAQAHVRAQFDRQVAHYLHGSAMADQELLERIARLAHHPFHGERWDKAEVSAVQAQADALLPLPTAQRFPLVHQGL